MAMSYYLLYYIIHTILTIFLVLDLMSFNLIMSFDIYILPFIKKLIRLSSIRFSNRPRTPLTVSNIQTRSRTKSKFNVLIQTPDSAKR